MERIIKANEYITNGFSVDEANKLLPEINKAFITDAPFAVDFKGVQFFTTLFFSIALTHLMEKIGGEEYKNRVKVFNLSESGEETYQLALNYAIEYYNVVFKR